MTAKTPPIEIALETGTLPVSDNIPENFDPLAAGILMAHQIEWLEDKAPLKIAEKCRRSGFTFAEALDDTITAATARGEGGDNVFYIGDTKEKGREFIGYCAKFAQTVAQELVEIDEFLFADRREDGETQHIAAFRIRFASGYQIVALSSRPENIRGLQGVVVIDEAAFHKDVGKVIDAAVALLIWGGRIRIISTHNGRLNPFNELVTNTRAGKNNYSLHSINFDGVIANGLYDRVKLMKSDIMPFEQWLHTIRSAYTDPAAEREELDTIPRDAEGAAVTRVQVEACVDPDIPVLRYSPQWGDEFLKHDPKIRAREVEEWCNKELAPALEVLHPHRRCAVGVDIARRGHTACFWIAQIGVGLNRHTKLVVEPRNVPFENLRQILFYIFDRLPAGWSAALDATGIGMDTAEAAQVKYGECVEAIHFSNGWYLEHGPKLITGIDDQSFSVPADDDLITDICGLAYVKGVVKLPEGFLTTGADGGKRHGDGAITAMLTQYASTMSGYQPYSYRPVRPGEGPDRDRDRPSLNGGFGRIKGAW